MRFKRAISYLRSELRIAQDRIDYCHRITTMIENKDYESVFLKSDPTEKEIDYKKHDINEMHAGWEAAKREIELELTDLESMQ